MTHEETLKIMSMLSAYYGEPKGDASQLANAWHLILQDYTYADAEKAVIDFAINDKRDYCVFPTIGKFLESVERMKKLPYRIIGKVRQGLPYEKLDVLERRMIGKEAYNRAMHMSDIELIDNIDKIVGYINKPKELKGE